jgi:molybdopterin synthase sulfur carrier subunit
MIEVLYFASLREAVGVAKSSHDLGGATVADLVDNLKSQGEPWTSALEGQLLCSVNQEMASFDAVLNDGDELALFPPVTGG